MILETKSEAESEANSEAESEAESTEESEAEREAESEVESEAKSEAESEGWSAMVYLSMAFMQKTVSDKANTYVTLIWVWTNLQYTSTFLLACELMVLVEYHW